MGATYSIYPNARADANFTIQSIPNICERQCRCVSDETSNAAGFVWSSAEGCQIKSKITGTTFESGYRTYVKDSRSNYYILWAFIFVIVILFFMGASMQVNLNAGNKFYSKSF